MTPERTAATFDRLTVPARLQVVPLETKELALRISMLDRMSPPMDVRLSRGDARRLLVTLLSETIVLRAEDAGPESTANVNRLIVDLLAEAMKPPPERDMTVAVVASTPRRGGDAAKVNPQSPARPSSTFVPPPISFVPDTF